MRLQVLLDDGVERVDDDARALLTEAQLVDVARRELVGRYVCAGERRVARVSAVELVPEPVTDASAVASSDAAEPEGGRCARCWDKPRPCDDCAPDVAYADAPPPHADNCPRAIHLLIHGRTYGEPPPCSADCPAAHVELVDSSKGCGCWCNACWKGEPPPIPQPCTHAGCSCEQRAEADHV